jgi:hypothetical protein
LKSTIHRLIPHFGQNFAEGANGAPQRLQASPDEICFPQFPQKVAPVCKGALQFGQIVPVSLPVKGVPQLTQRFAFCWLSVPHLEQGL